VLSSLSGNNKIWQPNDQHLFLLLQLCKGVSAEEAERYRLPADPMHDFNYLNQSGCSSIEGVDDATDFATLKAAMTAVGINHQQQTEVFEVLAGILWLGNIQFRAPTDDSVSVEPGAAVANAAALLQMSEPALMSALTSRNIVARGETIVTQLKMDGAVDARDALAKATYAGMPSIIASLAYSRLVLSISVCFNFTCPTGASRSDMPIRH